MSPRKKFLVVVAILLAITSFIPAFGQEATLTVENQGSAEQNSADSTDGSGGGTTVVNRYITTFVENNVTSQEVYNILDEMNLSREDPSSWAVASWELAKKKGFVVGFKGTDNKIYWQAQTPADRQEVTAIALRVYEQMLNDLKGSRDKLTFEFDSKLTSLDRKVSEHFKKLRADLETKIAEEAKARAEADSKLAEKIEFDNEAKILLIIIFCVVVVLIFGVLGFVLIR